MLSGASVAVINENFQKISDELQNKVLYRNNTSGEPNSLSTDLDTNGKRVYNLPAPASASEAARLQDVTDAIASANTAVLTSFSPVGNIVSTNVQGAIQEVVSDLAVSSGASTVGFISSGTGSTATTVQTKLREMLSAKDLGANPSPGVDNRMILITAMNTAVSLSKTLYIPDGVYECNDWLPIPSGLRMVFAPNAVWKLAVGTGPIGGFLIGGYDISLAVTPFDDVEIHNMTLDCNNLVGENGFNAVSANNVRLFNPKIYNTRHTLANLGGRAFQFEGGIIDGVHIYSPYIEDCSIGINSQGDPAGGYVARNINYYNVVMRNVCIPFNIDSQFGSPETNTLLTMSTFVHGAELFNCGRITWPGDTSAGLGGGIVCGDRGYGLKISGMRIVNTAAYGSIGALVRGKVFGIELNDVQMQTNYAVALFDFNAVGFGVPSGNSFPCTVFTDNIKYSGGLDYVIAGGTSNDSIGAACFKGVTIDSALATIAGVVDTNAGTGLSGSRATAEIILSDNSFKSSKLRSLADIYNAGNATSICRKEIEEGLWTPIDGSGAGLSFTITGNPYYVRKGRLVTAICDVTYPATASSASAVIGGLPFSSVTYSPIGGVGSIGYTNEATLSNIYVIGNSTNSQLATAAGGAVLNSTMSGKNVKVVFTYFA